MINVCVPVLKRYDLLRELLLSLHDSQVMPDRVCVINNGRDVERLNFALSACPVPFWAELPKEPMGVAESWNWFVDNVPEDRVIVNDDVSFAPDSLTKLVASKADLVWAAGCGFSCFIMRDACVQKVGRFDEDISPGYGYYEDEDYLQRLDGRGTREPSAVAENVECGVRHVHSATLKAATDSELLEHHRRFRIAQRNYMRKWNISDREMFGTGPAGQDMKIGMA